MSINRICVAWLLVVPLSFSVVTAQDHDAEMATLKKEIAAIRAKTGSLQARIGNEQKKAAADSASYAAYVTERQVRLKRLEAERDSLRQFSRVMRDRRDSLAAGIEAARMRKESLENTTTRLRKALQKQCEVLIDSLESFAVYNVSREVSALRFLAGEIKAGTVTDAEALERIRQVVCRVEEAAGKIETWNGASPVASVKGEMRFLRIGLVWVACAAVDNSVVFAYNAEENKWDRVEKGSAADAVREAVATATGMTAPKLAVLPVAVPLAVAAAKEGDEK